MAYRGINPEAFSKNASYALQAKQALEEKAGPGYDNGSPVSRATLGEKRMAGDALFAHVRNQVDRRGGLGPVASDEKDRDAQEYLNNYVSQLQRGPFGYELQQEGGDNSTQGGVA